MPVQAKPGEDIDAFCLSCDLVLAHVVIALKGKNVARVQCKTCNQAHAFRAHKKAPAVKKASSKANSAHNKAVKTFAAAMQGRDVSRATTYSAKHTFKDNDLVAHATFGTGVVTQVLADHKIVVIFESQERILVHARA